MKLIGYISTTIIIGVYAALMNGWALEKLWAWFIVPVFKLPVLTIPEATGFALVVTYLTTKVSSNKESGGKYWEVLVRGATIATFRPLFALGFGAVVKLWL